MLTELFELVYIIVPFILTQELGPQISGRLSGMTTHNLCGHMKCDARQQYII